jgi:hypothetical protein
MLFFHVQLQPAVGARAGNGALDLFSGTRLSENEDVRCQVSGVSNPLIEELRI